MHIKTALVAALAATVSAQGYLHPGALAAKRDIMARQSSASGGSTTCLTALMSIYSSIPTPPPEILSYESSHPVTDPCTYSIPNSLTSAFSSYESQALSWFSAHSSELFAALSQCPQYSSLATAGSGPPVCTNAAGGAPAASATTTGGGSAATNTGASASSSGTASKNAGPKETGIVGAVIAAAGFLGVVAAL